MAQSPTTIAPGDAAPELAEGEDTGSYLLVFDGDSSQAFRLPSEGEVVVGREESADLVLRDPTVSRSHAKLIIGPRIRIQDLGSQGGTRVNGQTVSGERELLSLDVIIVGSTTLVFNNRPRRPLHRSASLFPSLRDRAEQEISRSLRYERALTILTLYFGPKTRDRGKIDRVVGEQLRLADVFGWDEALEQLIIVLPESDAAAARVVAGRLLEHEVMGGEVAAGVASCPADGVDVETLFATSRAAAREARPREVEVGVKTARIFALGEQQAIIADPAMLAVYELVRRLAAAELPVLILGETGSGKELIARAVHHFSRRAKGQMVSVSCAAIPESLIESELLGHDRGAFSGAVTARVGLFEAASGGTLFLDEVGELPLLVQAKFLRLLESNRIARLGETKERIIDVRVVAATNRDLSVEVKAGRFRQDLFYRLSGGLVWVPPLRDRPQDIPVLSRAFLAAACARNGRPPMDISNEAMLMLLTYPWPGNVRELNHVLEYVSAAHPEPLLSATHLQARLGLMTTDEQLTEDIPTRTRDVAFRPIHEELQEIEQKRMITALDATGWNRTKAAELIHMPIRTFLHKLKKYGLKDP